MPLTVACPRWVEGRALPCPGVAATSLQGAGPDLVLLFGQVTLFDAASLTRPRFSKNHPPPSSPICKASCSCGLKGSLREGIPGQ